MHSDSMSPVQRIILLFAAACLFPSVILIGWLFREISLQQLESIEKNGKQAAELIVHLADTRAEADMTALRVLASAPHFATGDFVGAQNRAEEVLSLIPGWKAVILTDGATGEVFTATADGVAAGAEPHTFFKSAQKNGFGGVEREGPLCPCVRLQVVVPDVPDLILTAVVDPAVYQTLLMQNLPQGAVVAFVDQSGDFIARSLDFDDRVGTPATKFVRDAVVRGGRGTYEGKTFEGMINYTAYTVSATTGWSSHVAINTALLNRPREVAGRALLTGALAAILIGAILFTYVARDIAARRLDDKRLMEFQKAEAMKTFTATVVHDFRNIAAAVQSGLRLIVRQTHEPRTKEYAMMVGEAMDRGTRLANRLLKFAKDDDRDISDIEIKPFLVDLEYLLQQAAGPGVQVNIATPDAPVRLRANRDQLELALVNLVVNARDAMDGRGQITIGVVVDANQVSIRVADSGPGIPPNMRQQVFARFFTTKPQNGGSGLGLSQVSEMMKDAHGQVSIDDAAGGGAVFTLRFNRVAEDLAADENATAA